jgi:hypothetical protein
MSLNITVYCRKVPSDLAPKMMKRLNEFDMVVQVHPDFKFNEEDDSGFVPFKFRLKNPKQDVLKGKELVSGFELYIDDFDLDEEKEGLKIKPGFFARLRGKKAEAVDFAPPEIERRLRDCRKSISFVWNAGNSFDFRFAALTSAIITELTNGVRCYTDDEIWYENKNIVEEAYKEVIDYENSLPEEEIEFHEFEKW